MLIRYLNMITIFVILNFSTLEAGLFDNPKTGKGSLDPISALSGDGSGIDEIIKLITSINGQLDDYFNQLNIDNLVNQIGGDSKLFSCMTQGIDVKSIIPKGVIPDGFCKNMYLDLDKDIDFGKMAKCTGVKIPSIKDVNSAWSKFCQKGGTGSDGSIDGSITAGGAIQKPTKLNPKGVTYSSVVNTLINSSEMSTLPSMIKNIETKNLKDVVYNSGKTGDEIYFKDGGILEADAKKYPKGSVANAFKNFDKATLYMKLYSAKGIGVTDTNIVKLPKTMGDVAIETTTTAKAISSKRISKEGLIKYIVTHVQPIFKNIDANTTEEYYRKEKEAYQNFIKNDKELQSKIIKDIESLKEEYSARMTLESKKKDYLIDPSQTRANQIVKEQRTKFKYLALMQNTKTANMKTKLLFTEIDRRDEIDKIIRQAYSKASLWRGDIAKKEIDTMLSAVDQIIK